MVATKPLLLNDPYMARKVGLARKAGALRHPHVLAHFGVALPDLDSVSDGEFGGAAAQLVMEWCDGGSMLSHMDKPTPPAHARVMRNLLQPPQARI